MTKLADRIPPQRTETAFEDFKGAFAPNEAVTEANRCLYCWDAPCITECPTDIDVPEFIRKIATGNLKGAARTIFEANVFGMSCSRVCPVEVLCAGACVYNELKVPPIAIGKLQRYATDTAYDAGWSFFEAGPDTGKSVGLVGGGPASLAAAHALRRAGHACTIYESREVLGGLNTWGVAPYKLRADRAAAEVDWVLSIGGIEVKTGVTIGEDLSWDALQEKHDAVFLGIGLGADAWLELPGSELEGVEGAVAFIERFKLGQVSLDGVKCAVVIGGGNTAIDAVRELAGLGVPRVRLLYRRTEDEMPGYRHEWVEARAEGVWANWRTLPTAFEGDGKLERVRVTEVDADRKPIAGSEVVLDAQLALMAIGQSKLDAVPDALEGVVLDRGKVVIDEQGATGRPGVFAGGDCTNGGKEVVNAVAEGKAAAAAIDRYLKGGAHA